MYCHDLGVTIDGYGLLNGFIDHLYTRLGSTSHYSAIANLHTLQITTAPAKAFSSLLCLHAVKPGRSSPEFQRTYYLHLQGTSQANN
jgi:hypothetical protein